MSVGAGGRTTGNTALPSASAPLVFPLSARPLGWAWAGGGAAEATRGGALPLPHPGVCPPPSPIPRFYPLKPIPFLRNLAVNPPPAVQSTERPS